MKNVLDIPDRFNAWVYSKILIMLQWKQDEVVTKEELYFEPAGFKKV